MRVILEPSVFEPDAVDTIALLAVFQHCRVSERHWLEADEKRLSKWLERFPETIGKVARWVIERGKQEKRRGGRPGRSEIRVGAEKKSSWRAKNPKGHYSPLLSPNDAVKLLQAPLRLLVEDAWSERAFLFNMSQGGQRNDLRRAVDKGWVIFEHGGGIGQIGKTLAKIRGLDQNDSASWIRWLRLWVMFDRDGRKDDRHGRPDDCREPSADAEEALGNLLAIRNIVGEKWPGGARLERRTIENYLPKKGLETYTGLSTKDPHVSRQRQATCRAFFHAAMDQFVAPDDRRAFFPMAKGLKCLGNGGTPLYDNIGTPLSSALHEGFGQDVKDLWSEESRNIQDAWISAESHHPKNKEISALIDDILERI